jgi:hypothetical protein
MRIKSFKLFESLESLELITNEDIKDFFIDLIDDGYHFELLKKYFYYNINTGDVTDILEDGYDYVKRYLTLSLPSGGDLKIDDAIDSLKSFKDGMKMLNGYEGIKIIDYDFNKYEFRIEFIEPIVDDIKKINNEQAVFEKYIRRELDRISSRSAWRLSDIKFEWKDDNLEISVSERMSKTQFKTLIKNLESLFIRQRDGKYRLHRRAVMAILSTWRFNINIKGSSILLSDIEYDVND